ncbi:MAG: hypothetical protein ABI608_03475 [Rhizomicrobium sp.]
MRQKTIVLLGLAVLLPLSAASQPASQAPQRPTESVTVTGIKPSAKVIDDFVLSHTAPTRVLGKIARWKSPICPLTMGLGEKYAPFVSQRIRRLAAQIGAPVDADKNCKPNIRVVFTTRPQELMDNIRRDHPDYLGYYQSRLQSAQLAAITHPIQSWYTTATLDLRGRPQIDSGQGGGISIDVIIPGGNSLTPGGSSSGATTRIELPNASSMNVSGNRMNDGLSSTFFNVLVVAEPAKLLDVPLGTLADYIAMLALSQPGKLEGCAEFPTILNLLVPDCPRIATNLTDGDLAYLKALYKMTPANTLSAQRGEMRYQMVQELK